MLYLYVSTVLGNDLIGVLPCKDRKGTELGFQEGEREREYGSGVSNRGISTEKPRFH